MATVVNAVGNGLTGSTGTGKFVGDTSPTIVTPKIGTIDDTNGVSMLSLTPAASAVNYFNMQNQIASSNPVLSAVGSDPNISMVIQGKGTGGLLLKGAINGSATSAGYVGEIISSQVVFANATNINNNTATNLTSISLTAGNWLVLGSITFFASGNVITQTNAWASSTSASAPDASIRSGQGSSLALSINSLVIAPVIFRQTSTTTIYLSGLVNLSSGTCTQSGFIQATRLT